MTVVVDDDNDAHVHRHKNRAKNNKQKNMEKREFFSLLSLLNYV